MKKVIAFLLVMIAVFIGYHPAPPASWQEAIALKPVVAIVQSAVSADGGFYRYAIQAPIYEELVYRGPLWLVSVLLVLLKISRDWEKLALASAVLVVPTWHWALLHPYPMFYQAIILIGGFCNGLIVFYLVTNERRTRVSIGAALPLVIFLHGLCNVIFVSLIWRFF
mgnify:CR=1 FL=1